MGVVRRAVVEGAGAAGRGVQETRPIVPLLLGLGVVVRVRLEPLVDGAVHKCGVDGRAAVLGEELPCVVELPARVRSHEELEGEARRVAAVVAHARHPLVKVAHAPPLPVGPRVARRVRRRRPVRVGRGGHRHALGVAAHH